MKISKKANALLEYFILIAIVVVAISGISNFLERTIKGYVKDVNDSKLKKPIPFLWQGALTISNQNFSYTKSEEFSRIADRIDTEANFVSLQAPTPEGMIAAILAVVDKVRGGGQGRRNPIARRERREYDYTAE